MNNEIPSPLTFEYLKTKLQESSPYPVTLVKEDTMESVDVFGVLDENFLVTMTCRAIKTMRIDQIKDWKLKQEPKEPELTTLYEGWDVCGATGLFNINGRRPDFFSKGWQGVAHRDALTRKTGKTVLINKDFEIVKTVDAKTEAMIKIVELLHEFIVDQRDLEGLTTIDFKNTFNDELKILRGE